MANVLAKLPQQRVRAPEKHPTVNKLEQLFDLMDELGLTLTCEWDVIHVVDKDRPQDKKWQIRDVVNSEYLMELPCYPGQYKLTKQVDVSPREAQPAPSTPVVPTKGSGLNHFKTAKKVKAKGKKVLAPKPVDPRVAMIPKAYGNVAHTARGRK